MSGRCYFLGVIYYLWLLLSFYLLLYSDTWASRGGGLKNTLVYAYSNLSLGGILLLCSFSRVIVVHFILDLPRLRFLDALARQIHRWTQGGDDRCSRPVQVQTSQNPSAEKRKSTILLTPDQDIVGNWYLWRSFIFSNRVSLGIWTTFKYRPHIPE